MSLQLHESYSSAQKTGAILGCDQIHHRFHSDFLHRSVIQHIEHKQEFQLFVSLTEYPFLFTCSPHLN